MNTGWWRDQAGWHFRHPQVIHRRSDDLHVCLAWCGSPVDRPACRRRRQHDAGGHCRCDIGDDQRADAHVHDLTGELRCRTPLHSGGLKPSRGASGWCLTALPCLRRRSTSESAPVAWLWGQRPMTLTTGPRSAGSAGRHFEPINPLVGPASEGCRMNGAPANCRCRASSRAHRHHWNDD